MKKIFHIKTIHGEAKIEAKNRQLAIDKFYGRKEIKTKEEARQHAIDWQHKQSERSMNYVEVEYWNTHFSNLAKKFHLVREFKENGII